MFNSCTRKLAEEEVSRRRAQSKTYTEPLPEDSPHLQEFLDYFYKNIFDKGAEMKAELERYSDTVGEHYKFLVPDEVSFDQFFSRYYYRCNVQYLMKEWQSEEGGRKIGRARSGESLAEMSSYLRNGGNSPAVVDTRRSGRRKPPSRSKSSDGGTPGVGWFLKESSKENYVENVKLATDREERNAMAFKLLEAARI